MPDPHETLLAFAQVSVAIAGFSGIIFAFGGRAPGTLTQLELRRVSNLFALSGFVLISSLLGASLQHVEALGPGLLWRGLSAIVLFMGAPWLILDWRKIGTLEAAERSQVKAYIVYPFNLIAIAGLLLQCANLAVLGEPWPFFLALVLITIFAFQQFILLVRMGFRDR